LVDIFNRKLLQFNPAAMLLHNLPKGKNLKGFYVTPIPHLLSCHQQLHPVR
jgi:hypothetical protein